MFCCLARRCRFPGRARATQRMPAPTNVGIREKIRDRRRDRYPTSCGKMPGRLSSGTCTSNAGNGDPRAPIARHRESPRKVDKALAGTRKPPGGPRSGRHRQIRMNWIVSPRPCSVCTRSFVRSKASRPTAVGSSSPGLRLLRTPFIFRPTPLEISGEQPHQARDSSGPRRNLV